MKPKDLVIPFSFDERRPYLSEELLSIPAFYDAHDAFTLPWKKIFEERPVIIEFCSGNGEWIIEKALSHPDKHFIAVEKRFDRVRKIWAKTKNRKIKNLFIVLGAAETFAEHYVPKNAIEKIFVNFPDPWPKKRHAKHRLIQPPFIKLCSKILKEEGEAILVTDHTDYKNWMVEALFSSPTLEPRFEKPYYVTEWKGFGASYFDRLWRDKGKEIYYLSFLKKEIL